MRLEFTLDCTDLDRSAEFWQAAVGFVADGSIEGRYISLSGRGVTLTLQRVAEPKTGKNGCISIESIGASRVTPTARQEFGQTWFVLVDPDGNELCVAQEQH
jgi:catechol 2,3-dioxygenase-like lactoylglutathione lyase family enzyme